MDVHEVVMSLLLAESFTSFLAYCIRVYKFYVDASYCLSSSWTDYFKVGQGECQGVSVQFNDRVF